MIYKWLKWSRVIVALILLLLTSLIFLDFRGIIDSEYVSKILFLQFTPSLIKFIKILSISAAGFLVILILTFLFGRIYCSALCPLGIFQDIVSRTGKLFKIRKKYKYRKPSVVLRNIILGIVVLTLFTGSIFLVNLLDPYSMYGKFANSLLRPVGIWINNLVAVFLENKEIYYLYHIDSIPVRISTIIFPAFILVVVLVLAGKYGRLYCNTICPVGTLLGWLSKISLFRVVYDENKCTKCGKCSLSCKSECINIKDLSIDHSSCVACFNCLITCPEDAIHYRLAFKRTVREKSSDFDRSKRRFISTTIGSLAMISGACNTMEASGDTDPLNERPTKIPEEKKFPVSPPGSLSIDHFTSLCTACQLCISQCPTAVLQPSVREYGWTGFMQPHMDYNTNYCNFSCVKCSEVCPTGAIMKISEEAKKTVQVGKVVLIIENCVVYTENTACGSCSEHCPTQAVRMVPYLNGLTIPEIDDTICVGCGACEYACPVRPFKAIYVDGNPIHEVAKEPSSEKIEEGELEDFPF